MAPYSPPRKTSMQVLRGMLLMVALLSNLHTQCEAPESSFAHFDAMASLFTG